MARLVAESMTRRHPRASSCWSRTPAAPAAPSGTARAARAEPDGYTLLLNHVAQATSATFYRKLSYDPAGAFEGIGRITDVPMTIVARADFAPNSIGESARLYSHQQGQRHLRPRRRGLGLAFVRHAARTVRRAHPKLKSPRGSTTYRSTPVEIQGVRYPSITSAVRALGIEGARNKIYQRIYTLGWEPVAAILDAAGLHKADRPRPWPKKRPAG